MREILLMLLLSCVTPVHPSCSPDKLAVYRMSLSTHWSEDSFPKHYPQWRPPAQWSKTIGYSHDGSAPLFRPGYVVSEGVRQFVEKGDSEVLERESGNFTLLDVVVAPSIEQGEGRTEALVFVDGNHTKVSFITAIVPSPDWFIGLDSVDLCTDDEWIDTIKIEVGPMDAGTDNGLTFTSPNWATEPRDEVVTITNTSPDHPAGSFNYPQWESLPTIATYSLHKDREYILVQQEPRKTKLKEKKTGSERYKYDVDTNDSNEQEIDFVVLDDTARSMTKINTTQESDTKRKHKHRKILSQFLSFDDGVDSSTVYKTTKRKYQNKFEFIPLKEQESDTKLEKYREIISNEIPTLELHEDNFTVNNHG